MGRSKSFIKKLFVNAMITTFALSVPLLIPKAGNVAYASMDKSEFSSNYSYPTEMRGLSAFQITADMGAGWNLGNSFESENNETGWGNPRTTKAMIDAIAARGFKTLRIPVRWDDNYSDPNSYTIKSDYMDRVETVVNYGLANGMYVIINVHHNDLQGMVTTDYSTKQRVKNELTAIWTQVGNRFKNYGDKLIFEVNNEPRSGNDWNGSTDLYNCVNEYNEAGRSAIRATGGNNSSRLVMLPTYCASSDEPKVYGWENLSNDKMIAVSIHAYLPFDFAFSGNGHSNWTDSDYNELAAVFSRYKSAFLDKNVPVVIGEFGATNKNNTSDREKCVSVYTSMAKQYGIPCIWWDNNRFETGEENFGIFNRNSYSFTYDGIAREMMNTYGSNTSGSGSGSDSGSSSSDTNYVSLFWGSSQASNWGQAVSVATTRCGGNFDASQIKPGGHFYVEYSGEKDELELILQSLSGGNSWCKVPISESGTANGHNFAKFSYENCVSAFGTSNFKDLLDKIYVGAKDNSLTVYSVCYDFGNQSSGNSSSSSGNNYVSLFWGSSQASNWGQAVSVATTRCGGDFDASQIKQGGYFYVEYDGQKDQVEFILQSLSGANNWGKASISESGSANGHYFIKISYDNCVSALGTNDFSNKLDKIHVGAKENSVTVYSVCYCY